MTLPKAVFVTFLLLGAIRSHASDHASVLPWNKVSPMVSRLQRALAVFSDMGQFHEWVESRSRCLVTDTQPTVAKCTLVFLPRQTPGIVNKSITVATIEVSYLDGLLGEELYKFESRWVQQ